MDQLLSVIYEYSIEIVALIISLFALYKSSTIEKRNAQIGLLDRKKEITREVGEASKKLSQVLHNTNQIHDYLESAFRIAGHQNITQEVIEVYALSKKYITYLSEQLDILEQVSNRVHRIEDIPELGVIEHTIFFLHSRICELPLMVYYMRQI